jgi:hypothetical protein
MIPMRRFDLLDRYSVVTCNLLARSGQVAAVIVAVDVIMYSVIQAGIAHQVADEGGIGRVGVVPQSLIVLLYTNREIVVSEHWMLLTEHSMARGQNQYLRWPGNDSATQRNRIHVARSRHIILEGRSG